MTAICRAIRRAAGVPVTGLCHGVMHTERTLAHFIGAPPEEVTALAVGVNHLTWIFDLRWRGQDAWPLARERVADAMAAGDNPFSWSLFNTYGAFPAPNDRHTTEFFPERFPHGNYHGRTLGVDVFSFEDTIEHGDRTYAEMKEMAQGQRPLNERIFQRSHGEHEQLLSILHSLEYDERRIFSVNLPNRGAVPELPFDAVLELPAAATARGFCPLHVDGFPLPLVAVLQRVLAAQELTVEAALTGNRQMFVEALLADGSVSDPAAAGKLADDLLSAHRAHLPQFV
jgi:alpha-galactosidase